MFDEGKIIKELILSLQKFQYNISKIKSIANIVIK